MSKYPMHQKVDPWGGQHYCQCPMERLIGMDQFKTALAEESLEVKEDIALVNKLIIKANTDPKFDWDKSTYPAFRVRLNQLNPKVIIYFIAGYESHGHGSNWPAMNTIDVYDWYDKLLETDGLWKPYKLLATKAYLLYFQFDDESIEPEKLFNLKKRVADFEPGYQNCISAANAGKKAKK